MRKTIKFLAMATLILTCLSSEANASEITMAEQTNEVSKLTEKVKIPVKTTIKISAAGDCTLGSDLSYGSYNSFMESFYTHNDYGFFMENVEPIFRKDDLTIVNLEGPLTNSTLGVSKEFVFKGNPEFSKILSMGSIEAVNLANNHTMDYGVVGYQDTIDALNAEYITYFDANDTYIKEVNGIKVGLIGMYPWGDSEQIRNQISNRVEQLREQGAKLIIASFHWGIEKDYYPAQYQQNLAHFTIDEGVDLILGHHPHRIQGIEEYNGKYIVYSLGNFSFGGHRGPSDMDSMIFVQDFEFIDGELKIDGNHQAEIIPVSISSIEVRNDFKPTPLVGDEQNRVYNKIKEFSTPLNDDVDEVFGEIKYVEKK